MAEIKRIGVLTSGGDAPGMNAAVRAVTRLALHKNIEVMGIYNGYQGLIDGNVRQLHERDVSYIINRGGTMLHTARSPQFKTQEGVQAAIDNCKKIIENREKAKSQLESLGFSVTNSKANFLFVKHEKISGEDLYLKLKEEGVLVRHFDSPRIKEYNRITVGNDYEMQILIEKITKILGE